MQRAKRTAGFTLIELLVAIAIIALLSGIIFASVNSARARSRDAKRLASIREIQTALELYYADNNVYPGDPNVTWGWMVVADCNNNPAYPFLSSTLVPRYIPVAIEAPQTNECYWYQVRNNGAGYLVMFTPEDKTLLTKDNDCYKPAQYYCVGSEWQ